MNTDKIKKLSEVKDKLKSEFVGIDEIIDKVIDSVSPWYLTPEILERPTVVSLWGLTGTGKTSLIRKLVKYLGMSGKTLFFDCGEQGGSEDLRLFSDKLDSLFENSQIQESDPRFSEEDLEALGIRSDQEGFKTKTDPLDYTFVFDEFQYLNTKNPLSGEEEARPEGRAIWGLMDSGLIDTNRLNHRIKDLTEYIEDLEFFSEEHPGIKLMDGYFDPSMGPLLKRQLTYYRWEEQDEEKGYEVILGEDLSLLIRKLNILQRGLGFKMSDEVKSTKCLPEFIQYVKKYLEVISKPKIINCSKSLIFLLGNLDEAFELSGGDLDPDIDADVYHETTSKVNCMDIKTSLRKRFRDEQIGRMGNNIIIYPSLRRKDFEEIINREVVRISEKTKKSTGKTITVSDGLKKLMYSEGCFPIQGVRPLFSTINTLLSPLLSMIMMMREDNEYLLDVVGTDFNVPKITIEVRGKNTNERNSKEISLNLGVLRSLDRCKKIGLQAIHEASHAVLYYYLTGKTPSAIVASNVFGDGGYMMNAVGKDFSVTSIQELREDIIVSLAGYYGERYFFEAQKCSLGSSADIKSVWDNLSKAFYESGFLVPMRYSEHGVSGDNGGVPFGFPGEEGNINSSLKEYFYNLCKETEELIGKVSESIRKVALRLCEKRCIGGEEFKEMMSNLKPVDSSEDDYYINIIKNGF